MSERAVVLLSGGLDSATVLWLARRRYDCLALSVSYGQRHASELDAAAALAGVCEVEHRRAQVDLGGGSALLGDGEVPKAGLTDEIPSTYVPARNTIMLSLALGWAEARDADFVFIGANSIDYSGYPDCRPEYVAALQRMADLATARAVEGRPILIEAPLMFLSKPEIIRLGLDLGVPYHLTSSCYDPAESGACGRCDSCRIRLAAFAEIGIDDPITYRERTIA